MAFGGFSNAPETTPLAEINMVPLIDVMLVLLVIFLVTAPLLTHSVKIELPRAASAPHLTRPDNIQLGIKADGSLYWNGEPIGDAALPARMADAAKFDPQPELHLHAERTTQYQRIAEVMSAAARAGLNKIGFVTDPAAMPGK